MEKALKMLAKGPSLHMTKGTKTVKFVILTNFTVFKFYRHRVEGSSFSKPV